MSLHEFLLRNSSVIERHENLKFIEVVYQNENPNL